MRSRKQEAGSKNEGAGRAARAPRVPGPFLLLAFCFLLLSTLTGCASPSDHHGRLAFNSYARGNYADAQALLRPLARKTDENFVLNNVRLGSVALADHDLDTAESAFLAAYEAINAVGTNDGGRTLGAVLVDEKLRIWRGEPYERAMANFYLGLVYYIRGEYDNARAAFENSLFKLRDYVDAGRSADGNGNGDAYRDVE